MVHDIGVNSSRSYLRHADRVGMAASTLCILHCIVTPVLLSLSSVAAHFLPSEESTHRVLAVLIAAIGVLAIATGYRRHRRQVVLLLSGAGLTLIVLAALFGDELPSHGAEVGVTFLGSGLMISSHLLNRTFCRNCRACKSSDSC